MARDWHAWHLEYDDPGSSLARRLTVVRAELCRVLEWLDAAGRAGPRVVSLCAGDGRDVLPVLASDHGNVRATLVEVDAELSAAARAEAARLGLEHVDVRTADAGSTDALADTGPADILLACGIFGNVTDEDVVATVQALPTLLGADGVVIWTRGDRAHPDDPSGTASDLSEWVRGLFLESGFEEVAYVRPDDADYRVGVHRLVGDPLPFQPGRRLFEFV
jgi:hypothetical protein